MLKVSNLCKSYGGQDLFDGVSFSLNPRERLGVVGRNGHGKTTLFRLIIGREAADSGSISVPQGYQVGYLEQHLNFTRASVLEEACLGLRPDQAYDSWRAEKILFGLGFQAEDMARPPSEFSGGLQVRLNLAKVLVSGPDLLLLDEPTNYLDIVSIRWLIRFLNAWKGELLLITHDRSFMDSVTTHTLGIHRRRVRKIQGTTDKLYSQIATEEEVYEKTRLNDEKRRKDVELFIRRFRAKARLANMVQSRVKTLEKKERNTKLEKIETLDFAFKGAPFSGKIMMEVDDIAFGYTPENPLLFDGLNFTVARDDRICIVGPNGHGKTTLLKILSSELEAKVGDIRSHPSLKVGYFEQTNTAALDPARTVEEEIVSTSESCTRQQARDVAGAMMFSGDQALKKISVLSGGEKSRVLLAKLLVSPYHLLLLDEPTNHLDMESCDSLMAAIDSFPGAVVLITHNEMFLKTLATRLLVFDRGRPFLHEGGYQDFLDTLGWTSEEGERNDTEPLDSKPGTKSPDRKALRKQKARIIQDRSRTLKPLESLVAELEVKIAGGENELVEMGMALLAASQNGDRAAIADLAKREGEVKKALDQKYSDLVTATSRFEQKSREFEEKLKVLEG